MLHLFVEVKRKDGNKIYHSYTGIIEKCETWERETVNGEMVMVPMRAIKDISGNGTTWHREDELEEVKKS